MALSFLNKRSQDKEMAFVDHLEELRWHIVRMLIAIIVFAVLIFVNMDWFFDTVILGPIRPDFVSYDALCRFSHWAHLGDSLCVPIVQTKLQATTFGSQFMSSISIAFVSGIIISFPYLFWEVWRFISPALTAKELSTTRFSIFFVSVFFFAGAAFGYYLLAPFTFSFLGNYHMGDMKMLETRPMLSDYVENLVDITFGSALAFQLPVVTYVLTRIGLVTPMFLKTYRKYAFVAILVIAAVITPSPDWMSQMIVTVPLMLLYEFSILLSKRVYKSEQAKMNS
ncbi:MAG TPA: twin-arginine translocase subunit TatC [Flavitalea sp.]|jgi:sec-independent protein translocase protein TatC|nr:twin-arginine translocase subunit TatC [Flavitalea sp.]